MGIMLLDTIPNDELRQDTVPHPDCEWLVVAGFAQTFNPYESMGINVVRVREIENEARACYDTTGSIPEEYTMSELRTCLFFYHRAFYYAGKRKAPTKTERHYLDTLIDRIHAKAKKGRPRAEDDDDEWEDDDL